MSSPLDLSPHDDDFLAYGFLAASILPALLQLANVVNPGAAQTAERFALVFSVLLLVAGILLLREKGARRWPVVTGMSIVTMASAWSYLT